MKGTSVASASSVLAGMAEWLGAGMRFTFAVETRGYLLPAHLLHARLERERQSDDR